MRVCFLSFRSRSTQVRNFSYGPQFKYCGRVKGKNDTLIKTDMTSVVTPGACYRMRFPWANGGKSHWILTEFKFWLTFLSYCQLVSSAVSCQHFRLIIHVIFLCYLSPDPAVKIIHVLITSTQVIGMLWQRTLFSGLFRHRWKENYYNDRLTKTLNCKDILILS